MSLKPMLRTISLDIIMLCVVKVSVLQPPRPRGLWLTKRELNREQSISYCELRHPTSLRLDCL